MARTRYTIDFSDLFDWELESDRHLYNMVCGPYAGEEMPPPDKQEARIVLKHKRKSDGNNNTKTYKRSLPGINQEGI